VRTAGHTANIAIQQVDNIEAPSAHGLVQAGLLVAEASVHHQAALSVRLLGAGEVLSAAFVVVVTPGTSMAVAALEVLTEEAMEATGKPKRIASGEGSDPCGVNRD
jgi:alkylhydroperoxidase/carboxymuconolactone decarboxylase family protein YurZ